jgi:3-hydroxy-9,10-secoandrosta-1,3,5(10)-triene-9,17-dione monooxygenase
MVPALALTAAMPALGSAELVADLFARRLSERVIAYSGAAQKDQPTAQVRLGDARARLRAIRALTDSAAEDIQARVGSGEHIGRDVRAGVRVAAAHVVHESRSVIADLLEASGASAQFLNHPLQRAKRDVDVISGHVVFDYDGSRELAGALEIGAKVSPFAMV